MARAGNHNIAEFDPLDGPLVLTSFPNGGWIVTQGVPESGFAAKELGAYSSAREMLFALRCLKEKKDD